MALLKINGTRLNVDVTGRGDLVVLVMGSGSPGQVWHTYQVPALVAAGFTVVTFDSRGLPPSDHGGGPFTVEDMIGDVGALIEHFGAPANVVGTSLGARIVQELTLGRPDLVKRAVLMATAGRPHPVQVALSAGERALHAAGIELPAAYHAANAAIHNLSPASLVDARAAEDWLALFEFAARRSGAGVRGQWQLADVPHRLADYRRISRPCLVIGFADDRLLPPFLGREVATAIPGARYELVERCGHLGYLERPDAVNAILTEFLCAADLPVR